MKNVCVVTATRAEYSLLKPLIIRLNRIKEFNVNVVVTGMHLSDEFGNTYKEIEHDGIEISKRIPILENGDRPIDVSKTIANALNGFAKYFLENHQDLLVVLGDRYELIGICMAAVNENIAIAHIHGGETTEGAIDEVVRHSVTKMSQLHFTSTQTYRKRVIQLGESPDRVFEVGALGVENVMNTQLMPKNELSKCIGFSLENPYAVVTFHPVTRESDSVKKQIEDLLKSFDYYNRFSYIITKSNADSGGRMINQMLEDYVKSHENVFLVSSLGMVKYLSAVKYSEFVIGNSSSGIIEVPSFKVPTVNIGFRQKGRIQAKSIINCLSLEKNIINAISKAISLEFKESLKNVVNPYGDGITSKKIAGIIEDYLINEKIDLKKVFYDIDFEI